MDKAKNSKRCKICSKEEFERFVSIYTRFKQIIKGPDENLVDFSYKQTELVNDVREFWSVIAKIVAGLIQSRGVNITWDSDDLEVIEKVIYGDVIPVKWGPICIDDPPPFWNEREKLNAAKTRRERSRCERWFDLIMVNLCKCSGLKKEVVSSDLKAQKQTLSDSGEKSREEIVSLPPILPELDMVPDDWGPEIKRLLNLCWLGYSVAVYARDNRCSRRQKVKLITDFAIECNETLFSVSNLSESFEGNISDQDRVDLFKDFEQFCLRLKKLVEDSISNNSAGFSKFYYLFFDSLSPLIQRTGLMSNIVGKQEEKALVKGLEKILKQAEQKTKKRGKGVLDTQVSELLKSSASNITAREIAETLNKNYAGIYKETSNGSVRNAISREKRKKQNKSELKKRSKRKK